jgi:Peptidase C39 family
MPAMTYLPLLVFVVAVSQTADRKAVRGINPDRPGELEVRTFIPIPRASSKPASPTWAITDPVRGSMRACGANCLFVWLRLRHVDCQLERLRDEVPVSDRGSNMADLVEVAKKYGESARVVEGSLPGFSVHVPFIARMKAVTGDLHHFVVVTRLASTDVDMIDGTSGRLVAMPRSRFSEGFTEEGIIGVGTRWQVTPGLAVWLLMFVSGLELAAILILLTRQAATGKR